MFAPDKIGVMISSRCSGDIVREDDTTVTYKCLRGLLKKEIEDEKLFGKDVFQVWISEDAPAEDGSSNSWDTCLRFIDDADIILVLYNGHSGGVASHSSMGICHAELARAMSSGRGRVRLIKLPPLPRDEGDDDQQYDAAFKDYVDSLNLYRDSGETVEKVIQQARRPLPLPS